MKWRWGLASALGFLVFVSVLLMGPAVDDDYGLEAGQQRVDSTVNDGSSPSTPMTLSLASTTDLAANLRGGIRRRSVTLGNLDATLQVDGERVLGWEGMTFFLYGLANYGGAPTTLAGDAQVASNIEAPEAIRLYEAWIQQNFPEARISLLAGLYDVNSEFDAIEEASMFLNSSFGIGPELSGSGRNGPSIFPVTSLGVRAQWHPSREVYIQGAVVDGVPGDPSDAGATAVHLSSEDGVLWVAEIGLLGYSPNAEPPVESSTGRDHGHEERNWRIAVGTWRYSEPLDRIGPGEAVRGHPGLYFLAEGSPSSGSGGTEGLGAFLRLGLADDRTNRFGAYTGGGVTYTGLISGRGDDIAGFGVAVAWNGGSYNDAARSEEKAVTAAETTLELTYRASPTSWLTLQPDIQLILNPDSDHTIPHALLGILRVSLIH